MLSSLIWSESALAVPSGESTLASGSEGLSADRIALVTLFELQGLFEVAGSCRLL